MSRKRAASAAIPGSPGTGRARSYVDEPERRTPAQWCWRSRRTWVTCHPLPLCPRRPREATSLTVSSPMRRSMTSSPRSISPGRVWSGWRSRSQLRRRAPSVSSAAMRPTLTKICRRWLTATRPRTRGGVPARAGTTTMSCTRPMEEPPASSNGNRMTRNAYTTSPTTPRSVPMEVHRDPRCRPPIWAVSIPRGHWGGERSGFRDESRPDHRFAPLGRSLSRRRWRPITPSSAPSVRRVVSSSRSRTLSAPTNTLTWRRSSRRSSRMRRSSAGRRRRAGRAAGRGWRRRAIDRRAWPAPSVGRAARSGSTP